jgi:hypothetical protein
MSKYQTWEQTEDIPMPWSLGPIGDMVWIFLPGCRAGLAALATRQLQSDLDDDGPLGEILDIEIFLEVVNPAMKAALEGADRRAVEDNLNFLRRALTYRGAVWKSVQYQVHAFVIEWLMLPPYRDILKSLDGELEAYIRSLFGEEW